MGQNQKLELEYGSCLFPDDNAKYLTNGLLFSNEKQVSNTHQIQIVCTSLTIFSLFIEPKISVSEPRCEEESGDGWIADFMCYTCSCRKPDTKILKIDGR